MIKNIIFDLGNVLLRFNPMDFLLDKIKNEEKAQEVYNEIFLSDEWLMLDRGIMTQEEAVDRLCRRSHGNGTWIRLAMDKWYDMLTPIEETVVILKELKDRGYCLYYLSNFHMLAFEHVTTKYDFFNCFDGGVVSYEEKLLKPEADIYKKVIGKYSIDPIQSIFIDDTKVNVEEAKKHGFQTVHFRDRIDLDDLLNVIEH